MVSLVSNPPFNLKWDPPMFAQLQPRFSMCELPPGKNANYAFLLTALDMIDGKAAMILPCGVLTTSNAAEVEIRKFLVEKNYIEAVITCPEGMFESTNIPTCIIVLNKNKATTHIVFVDMRQTYDVEVREQNGQYGGASHERRTYKKNVKVLTDEQMQKAVDAIADQTSIPKFSKVESIQTIADMGYLLSPSRYIELEERECVHRSYDDIINDLNRVISDKNAVKLTMNETLAKALGLYDVFQMFKQAEQTHEEMNKGISMFSVSDKRIIKEQFISMTKDAGQFKLENRSKDSVSTILLLTLNMWKQHIMYLNDEENRYLAELRDALLPDLMSGKLQVNDG